jgi:hypothetical protein
MLAYPVDNSCFAPDYHHRTPHALSLSSIRIYYDRRGGTWQKARFSKKSSDHEGVFTWSVLLLVAVVDSYTFNSGTHAPWIPDREGALSFNLPKSLPPTPNHPVASLSNIHPAVPKLTRERRVGRRRWAASGEHRLAKALVGEQLMGFVQCMVSGYLVKSTLSPHRVRVPHSPQSH